MNRRMEFSLRGLGIYAATLCPVAALFGALICSIELGGRTPLHFVVRDAGIGVLGLFATACIGHVVARLLLPAPRSTFLTSLNWRFPVVCGIGASIACTVVEPITDVLGGWFGHRHDNVLAAGSVIVLSAAATALVVGIDRLFCRR